MQKTILGIVIALVLLIAAGALYWFVFRKDLTGQIVVPYIAHQKPKIDPHVPSSVPIADKLDDVVFDGLFNVSASPSGVVYENGLGELMDMSTKNMVTIRLKPNRKWHSSFTVTMDKKKIAISPKQEIDFTAQDLKFTLSRIQKLGSLSPDYILVSQAVPDFAFNGPNENGEIQFQFRGDRTWSKDDIKEILSFKVLPANSDMEAPQYTTGTGPYMLCGEYDDAIYFQKMPGGPANIPNFILKPFIDNSTYTTELKNRNINALLSTPFGAVSPILRDSTEYFYKSSIATAYFSLYFNTQKLSLAQRKAVRKLVNNKTIMERFFKIGTPQQRHIANYRGQGDNYEEYLNFSVFPTTTYYVEEKVVTPAVDQEEVDMSVLQDTVRIQTCLNYDFREELSSIVEILNDPAVSRGKIKATAVSNAEIAQGNYDAVLFVATGYRSNFLFDLYNVFLREPDFGSYRINLQTAIDSKGKQVVGEQSFTADKNLFRIDLSKDTPERADERQLLNYLFLFMSSREIGDKQQTAILIDQLEHKLALGAWLFSLPSLAYMSTQFDAASIDMYGTAAQLSTVEKWQESPKKKGLFGKLMIK
jgi:Bacterial extracellular solute-binding proteins, family 5 Middle